MRLVIIKQRVPSSNSIYRGKSRFPSSLFMVITPVRTNICYIKNLKISPRPNENEYGNFSESILGIKIFFFSLFLRKFSESDRKYLSRIFSKNNILSLSLSLSFP